MTDEELYELVKKIVLGFPDARDPLYALLQTLSAGVGAPVAWADITDKPAVIGAGATALAARTAIGAAPLDAPTFTGIAAATTPAVGTSTTQLATMAAVQAATKTKTQTVALAAIATADATDAATVITLANATKASVNAVIAALKA